MAKIPPEKVDQVREASDIVDVVSGYLTLRQRGRNYFGLCPFHNEKTPSFSVNPDMQIFHCFGCSEGGNVFTFIMKVEGLTFPDAVKILAQKAGIQLPEDEESFDSYREKEALFYALNMAAEFYLNSLKSQPAERAQQYLEKRGITSDDYELFGIGYAPNAWDNLLKLAKKKSFNPEVLEKAGLVLRNKDGTGYYDRFRGRITFAIRNLSGQVVGFGARRMVDDNTPKYINSPESEIYQKRFLLYGLNMSRDAIRRHDEVVIVEGYTDFTSLWKTGIQNVVATSGTALTEDHAVLLRRYTSNAVMLYDADAAGAAAALRGADILLENGLDVKICMVPGGSDPDEFVRANSEQAVKKLISTAVPLMDYKVKQLENRVDKSTVSQKADLTRQLLISMSKVNDPIRRAFLVRDLSNRLHIEEKDLWKEIGQLQQKRRLGVVKTEEPQSSEDDFFQTTRGLSELGLLEVALKNPSLITLILQNINLEHISHPEIRDIFTRLQNMEIDELTFEPQYFLAAIQNQTIASRLTKVLIEENPHPKPWNFARDCLIGLQQSIITEQLEHIEHQLEIASDKDAKNDLKKELMILLDERKKILRGEYIIEEQQYSHSDK